MTKHDFTPEPAWWLVFDESEATVACQHVWGARPGHRDELILRDRNTELSSESSSSSEGFDERLWSLMDYYDPPSAVNTEGEVVERYRFSAFGARNILAADFSPRVVGHYEWDFAFKGQFLDGDTGYYNYGFRYYSPELGRWLSRDPIGEKGGVNLYGLEGNNPVNLVDNLGLYTSLSGPGGAIALAELAAARALLNTSTRCVCEPIAKKLTEAAATAVIVQTMTDADWEAWERLFAEAEVKCDVEVSRPPCRFIRLVLQGFSHACDYNCGGIIYRLLIPYGDKCPDEVDPSNPDLEPFNWPI